MDRRTRAIAIAGSIGTVVLLCWYAASYSFLLDDSIIIRAVSERSMSAIFGRPLFDFYRPLTHAWVKTLFGVFGWNHPSGYIAGSLLLHAACASAVVALGRLVRLHGAALVAGVIFLLSPWATEPFLWMSGAFDLIAVAGILVCVIGGLIVLREASAVGFIVGVAGIAAAVCAKESAVVGPVLFVMTVVSVRGFGGLGERRVLAYTIVLFSVVGAYLLVRESLLPGLGGAYGDAGALLRRTPLAEQPWTFARALLWLPAPHLDQTFSRTVIEIGRAMFAAAVLALLAVAAARDRRIAAVCLLGMLVSIGPVIWAPFVAENTSGNRFLYLPGVWLSLGLAAGLQRISVRLRTVAAAVIVAAAFGSVLHQVRTWRAATALSRSTIEQLRPYDRSGTPLFVRNLPGLFTDGPYVMNTLAVRSFFGPTFPAIDANTMTMTFDAGGAIFAFWAGESREPRAGERVLDLSLPVWMGRSEAAGAIDAPRQGADVTQPFTVSGWAIDAGARRDPGVENVHVYAARLPGDDDGALVGSAAYGDARPDVASRFGPQFLHSGFRIVVSGLTPGDYRVTVHARRSLARGRDAGVSIDVHVR